MPVLPVSLVSVHSLHREGRQADGDVFGTVFDGGGILHPLASMGDHSLDGADGEVPFWSAVTVAPARMYANRDENPDERNFEATSGAEYPTARCEMSSVEGAAPV